MYYSLIGLLAALMLVITNHDVLPGRTDRSAPPVQRVYRRFLIFVLAYYVTDMLWGVLDALSLPSLSGTSTSRTPAA